MDASFQIMLVPETALQDIMQDGSKNVMQSKTGVFKILHVGFKQ